MAEQDNLRVMLLDEVLSPFLDIEQTLSELVEYLQGFLFLGNVPLGRVGRRLVYIAPIYPDGLVDLPFEIVEAEVYADTTKTTPVRVEIVDGKLYIPPEERVKLRVVGDKYILYFDKLAAKGDNLWTSYGKSLTDIYQSDNEGYRDLLIAFLKYFVLGPTLDGIRGLLPEMEVLEGVENPWWDGLLLPPDLVEVKDPIPKVGVNLSKGTVLPFDDTFFNEQYLSRYSKSFGTAYYNQDYPIHYQRQGEPLSYVYNGKTKAYFLMENFIAHHTYLVKTPAADLGGKINSILEGRPTHTRPILEAFVNVEEVIPKLEVDARIEVFFHLSDSWPKQEVYNQPGRVYNQFEKHTKTTPIFNEYNLFYNTGRFVKKEDGGRIVPALYAHMFTGQQTFNSKEATFGKKVDGIVPYGVGLVYFNGVLQKTDISTPYQYSKRTLFWDAGAEVKRLIKLSDSFYYNWTDNIELISFHYRQEIPVKALAPAVVRTVVT